MKTHNNTADRKDVGSADHRSVITSSFVDSFTLIVC